MLPCKKLIEVALPLEAINRESAREKSIRHGHPSTLHTWWARRPLAACRAVLFASLVDDPESDPDARKLSGETRDHWIGTERRRLHALIEELVRWENSNNPDVLNRARAEIARCVASAKIEAGEWAAETVVVAEATAGQVRARKAPPEAVNAVLAEHAPPVYDPFCGGGSIPLEAQRLGLRAFASDLNPVPVLITKALIEIPPRFAGQPPVNPEARKRLKIATYRGAQGLAEDVRYYGRWMRGEAERRIGHLYPKVKITPEMVRDREDLKPYVGQELKVIAWLWARTVASPNPAAGGTHVPLVSSFWLNKKQGKQAWVEPIVDSATMTYHFKVRTGQGKPREGTVRRRGNICLLTNLPMTREYIRVEGQARRMGSRLMAIVAEGQNERISLSPTPEHEEAATKIIPEWQPDNATLPNTRYTTPAIYGMTTYADLFTQRQLVALTTFNNLVSDARERVLTDIGGGTLDAIAYPNAVATYLGLVSSKSTAFHNTMARWRPNEGKSAPAFGRQAFPIVWDYAEVNPFAGAGGDFFGIVDGVFRVLESAQTAQPGCAMQGNATGVRPNTRSIFSTDPPYYDNVPYADLSDFFYVWLRRCLGGIYPDLFSTLLVPPLPS